MFLSAPNSPRFGQLLTSQILKHSSPIQKLNSIETSVLIRYEYPSVEFFLCQWIVKFYEKHGFSTVQRKRELTRHSKCQFVCLSTRTNLRQITKICLSASTERFHATADPTFHETLKKKKLKFQHETERFCSII